MSRRQSALEKRIDELLRRVEKLESENATLRAENATLRAENVRLTQENAELRAENERIRKRLDRFERRQPKDDDSKPKDGAGGASLPPPGGEQGNAAPPPRGTGAAKRKPGGQPGHKPHARALLPVEQVDEVLDHKPSNCRGCGRRLKGEDPEPRRHQVAELAEKLATVTEHRLHCLECPCGERTCADYGGGGPDGALSV